MYKLEFLPIAKNDIDNIIYYISINLGNKIAAVNLSKKFIDGANGILIFPYGVPVYEIAGKLKNEYRRVRVNNYLMFYTINEEKKVITIVRVLYRKMDIENLLK